MRHVHTNSWLCLVEYLQDQISLARKYVTLHPYLFDRTVPMCCVDTIGRLEYLYCDGTTSNSENLILE